MPKSNFINMDKKRKNFKTLVNYLSGNFSRDAEKRKIPKKLLLKAIHAENLEEEYINNSDID